MQITFHRHVRLPAQSRQAMRKPTAAAGVKRRQKHNLLQKLSVQFIEGSSGYHIISAVDTNKLIHGQSRLSMSCKQKCFLYPQTVAQTCVFPFAHIVLPHKQKGIASEQEFRKGLVRALGCGFPGRAFRPRYSCSVCSRCPSCTREAMAAPGHSLPLFDGPHALSRSTSSSVRHQTSLCRQSLTTTLPPPRSLAL